MATGVTRQIARFIAETGFDSIPHEAVVIAKNTILDGVGVAIAGSAEPAVKIMRQRIKEWGSAEEAGVIGAHFRTTAEMAAWINGTASHALDYDDTFSNAAGYNFHPTVPILAAVLALGEKCKSPGKDVVAAYIVGIEVESRVGAAIGRSVSEMGWHTTPVVGTMGAAAASANLLKLEHSQVQMALGIAASLSSGLLHNFGTMTKPLHAGNASRNGVISALLAQKGFTASDDVLEGELGFCSMFSGKTASTVWPHEQDLGLAWHIISPGIALKAYPCCRSTHSSIDASIHLRNVIGIDSSHLIKIICKTSPHHTKLARFHRPKSAYEAKFSIPYCVAVALLRGRVLLEDFTQEKMVSPQAQALLSKVNFLYPEEFTKDPMGLAQEVVVTLADGKEYACRVETPKGEPQNLMTNEELSAKFVDCAGSFLSPQEIDKVLEMIDRLELLHDISKLMNVVAYPRIESEELK
jgi:2-methylcitrate dehydratase PrpD